MECKAEIKKGTGLEGIIREHTPAEVDERLQEKTTGDNVLDEVMRKYEEVLEKEDVDIETIEEILTPSQINAFLQSTITQEQNTKYGEHTGQFITKLIQHSYNAGYNDFTLTPPRTLEKVGYELEGTEDKPIKITINGNVGEYCLAKAKYGIFKIRGNTGGYCAQNIKHSNCRIEGDVQDWFAAVSENSNLFVEGNVGEYVGSSSSKSKFTIKKNSLLELGMRSEDCTYQVQGNVGRGCGFGAKRSQFHIGGNTTYLLGHESEESGFTVNGNVGEYCGTKSKNSTFFLKGRVNSFNGHSYVGNPAEHSTYKTNNPNTLQKMLQDVPSGNRIIFIKSDGAEQIVRDYADKS